MDPSSSSTTTTSTSPFNPTSFTSSSTFTSSPFTSTSYTYSSTFTSFTSSSTHSYSYEVYFACAGLQDEEARRKVRNYFNERRKSGGGDCGHLEAHGGDVYRLEFRREEDQLRVLEKHKHVISGFPPIVVHANPPSVGHEVSKTITTAPSNALWPESQVAIST